MNAPVYIQLHSIRWNSAHKRARPLVVYGVSLLGSEMDLVKGIPVDCEGMTRWCLVWFKKQPFISDSMLREDLLNPHEFSRAHLSYALGYSLLHRLPTLYFHHYALFVAPITAEELLKDYVQELHSKFTCTNSHSKICATQHSVLKAISKTWFMVSAHSLDQLVFAAMTRRPKTVTRSQARKTRHGKPISRWCRRVTC